MFKSSIQNSHQLSANIIRVALIEDHDLTRLGIRSVLQRSGKVKVVGEATNAIQGLKLLRQTHPDVAIIDIGLPGMNGIELTRRFRQYRPRHDTKGEIETKVLMLTLHDDETEVLSAFSAGADSYCIKDSVSCHKLHKALQATYKGLSWVDPQIAHIVLKQNRYRRLQLKLASSINTVTINTIPRDLKQLLGAEPLTCRQLEVLQLVVAGYSNAEIAKQLYITIGTTKTHVRAIFRKLCVDDRTQAAVSALRAGLVS